ncbi:hypothetical protein QE152_g40291 [Popillia japonica]|uniref:Uncharacterized protein n=1 Tax=Popillia japonica TaxID=7064 RepID=A0AAW1HRM9_POPJA
MADNNAVPGPSDPKKAKLSVKKYYTDSVLLKIWEDSDFDDFDSVGGDSDGEYLNDYEVVNDDVTTQAASDLPSDSDKQSATDVPKGNAL